MSADPAICDHGGKGMLFPLSQAEHGWHDFLRAVLYAAALCYLFYGVNIVADKFMGSIEEITSKKRRVVSKETGKTVTVPVWNDTVATLTLLALGSSAPEILLSIVEIIRNGFKAGELGPSTIVGSAAFNLFMIVGVCIYSIPNGEVRYIKETGVYAVTAVFSLFAYLWLVFMVQVTSPDIIEPWEAIVTLALFPVLLVFSYLMDIGYWPSLKQPQVPPTQHPLAAPPLPPPAMPPPYQAKMPYQLGPEAQAMGHMAPHHHQLDFRPRARAPQLEHEPVQAGGGMISFPSETWEAHVGLEEITETIPVYRLHSTRGEVSCKYRMEGRTALPGFDFSEDEGELTFVDGATRAEVRVRLLPKRLGEHSDVFQIILEEPEGGACFDPGTDGGEDRCVLTVTIKNANDALVRQSAVLRASRWFDSLCNLDACRLGTANWRQEIHDAIFEVGDSEDDDAGPSTSDWIWHIISLPWNLLFALTVPPPQYLGGWMAFTLSLLMIGGVTAVIIDFAELFGCVAGVADSITAITFVALGTSMPDLFASMTAAAQEEHADASIVNVTGSNSVNVFLGIGLPWLMASIYWRVSEGEWLANFGNSGHPVGSFIVPGGNLGFSVVVFTVAALVCLVVLRLRRERCGGELGGPVGPKIASFAVLVCLWLFYIVLSVWKVNAGSVGFWTQLGALGVGVVALENVLMVAGVVLYMGGYMRKGERQLDLEAAQRGMGAQQFGKDPALDQYQCWPPGAGVAPEWASHMSGLRGAGAQYAGACQPRVLGAQPMGPSECKIRFSGAALVLLAAHRFKMGGIRSAHSRMLHEHYAPLRRSNSFHSCEDQFATPNASIAGDQRSNMGTRVAGIIGHHAADWLALSVAGLAARQLAAG